MGRKENILLNAEIVKENTIISMIKNNIEDIELTQMLFNQGNDINQLDNQNNNLLILSIQKSYIDLYNVPTKTNHLIQYSY